MEEKEELKYKGYKTNSEKLFDENGKLIQINETIDVNWN